MGKRKISIQWLAIKLTHQSGRQGRQYSLCYLFNLRNFILMERISIPPSVSGTARQFFEETPVSIWEWMNFPLFFLASPSLSFLCMRSQAKFWLPKIVTLLISPFSSKKLQAFPVIGSLYQTLSTLLFLSF